MRESDRTVLGTSRVAQNGTTGDLGCAFRVEIYLPRKDQCSPPAQAFLSLGEKWDPTKYLCRQESISTTCSILRGQCACFSIKLFGAGSERGQILGNAFRKRT